MSIIDDFADIRRRMLGEDKPEPACPVCEGGGWECYGTGYGDPHFRECPRCSNPDDRPSP